MPAFFAAVPIGDNLLFLLNAHPRKDKNEKPTIDLLFSIDYFLLSIVSRNFISLLTTKIPEVADD